MILSPEGLRSFEGSIDRDAVGAELSHISTQAQAMCNQMQGEKSEMSVCASGKRRMTIVGAGTKKNFPSREKLRSSKRHFSNSQLYAG